MRTIIVSVLGAVVAIAAILFGYNIHVENSNVGLRNQITAQEDIREAVHANVWQILQDQAGVAETYSAKFDEIFSGLIEGRYSGDGDNLMKWIQEAQPSFDSTLFTNIQSSIEAQRTRFFEAQKKLVDLGRELKDLQTKAPSSWVLNDKTAVEIQVITSTATEGVFDGGVDDSLTFQREPRT